MYLKGLIGLDHVIEGIDSKIVVDNFFFIIIFGVGISKIDVDDFLNLQAALF
jgi:hypothetical protein